jgi:hypothetical protein
MASRKVPDTPAPIQLVTLERRACVPHGPAERPDPDRDQKRECEHDREVPEREEEEADAQRSVALRHQLAGGVVDRRDMVRRPTATRRARAGCPRRYWCRLAIAR